MKDPREISTPVLDFVKGYAGSGMSRLHMPGHKGAPVLPGIAMDTDITEVRGADSLYAADGIIRESEENAAQLFGSGVTFYSTEGSSQCIRAMLALVTVLAPHTSLNDDGPERDSPPPAGHSSRHRPVILAARNVHRSFLTAAALLDLDVQWLYPPEGTPCSICSCPVSGAQVSRALEMMDPKPAAVYVTSPDYLGYLQDISAIARAAHAYRVPLLVDNAHGAYLHFLDQPCHPMDLGADLCCDSAHKTLPALTGCAYLHISKKAASLYVAHGRKALSLFGSTSPSYLLLQSLDQTNAILNSDYRSRLRNCVSKIQELRAVSEEIPGLRHSLCLPIPSGSCEPLKITLQAKAAGMDGPALADLLRLYWIECEYSDPDHVVLMFSPYNAPEDYERLKHAFRDLLPKAKSVTDTAVPSGSVTGTDPVLFDRHPKQVISIREAALAPSMCVPLSRAAGRICADLSLACPPGIPLVMCGEVISEEAVRLLSHYGVSHIHVL